MRFILHVTMPNEKFNEAVMDGTVGPTLGRILADMKPEAAYFCSNNGLRGGYFIVDVQQASDMTRLAEPFFLKFDATVEFLLCMTPEDLQAGNLEALATKWK